MIIDKKSTTRLSMITDRSDVARPARRDIACRPFLSSHLDTLSFIFPLA